MTKNRFSQLKFRRVIARIVLVAIFVVSLFAYCLGDGARDFFPRFLILLGVLLTVWALVEIVFAWLRAQTAIKTIDLLDTQCDPEAYLEATSDLAYTRKTSSINFMALYYRKGIAYVNCDQVDKAKSILQILEEWYLRQDSEKMKAWVAMLICSLSKCLENEAKFEKYFEVLGELLVEEVPKAAHTKAAKEYFERNKKKRHLLVEKNYSGLVELEDEYIAELEDRSVSNKVLSEFEKADYLRHLGRVEDEKIALSYVVEHGNKLACVAKAKARLAELGKLTECCSDEI